MQDKPSWLSYPKERPILVGKAPMTSVFQRTSISATCTPPFSRLKEFGTLKIWGQLTGTFDFTQDMDQIVTGKRQKRET